MTTIRRYFLTGGALLFAAALLQCDGSVSTSNPDGGTGDMRPPSGTDMAMTIAPTLTAVSPSYAPNTGGAMVTLTGTNFLQGATVLFGGVAATNVIVASATQITAVVPAKAVTCGLTAVQVMNTNSKAITRTDLFAYQQSMPSAPTFAGLQTLPMGTTPRQVIAVDLNGDGNLDLVTANSGSANVTTRLGNGQGGFGNLNTIVIGTGSQPHAVAAADV